MYWHPTGHTTLLRRWINVIDVDSPSQQHRVPSGIEWDIGATLVRIISLLSTDPELVCAANLTNVADNIPGSGDMFGTMCKGHFQGQMLCS